MMRPRVGVTGPDRGGAVAWELTRLALRRAGGKAIRITPSSPRAIEDVDALVIGGGADIDPAIYGEEQETFARVLKKSKESVDRNWTPALSLLLAPAIFVTRKVFERHTAIGHDTERDSLEMMLIDDALKRDLPILGICRGAQLLNVCLGGSLHQDVADFYVEKPQLRSVLPRKVVNIAAGSHLARVIGAAPCSVNALHHQAIDDGDLGRDVAIVAREDNGIVQGIEVKHARFAIGVQWHPEYIPQHRRQQALFEALVDCAA